MGLFLSETVMAEATGQTYPAQCSSVKKGHYIVIKDRPCKVIDTSTSKTGKHGHAKVNMTALDIFTNKKLEDSHPSTHNVMVPVVVRSEYMVLSITDDGFLSLLLATDKPRMISDAPITRTDKRSVKCSMMERRLSSPFSLPWALRKSRAARKATKHVLL